MKTSHTFILALLSTCAAVQAVPDGYARRGNLALFTNPLESTAHSFKVKPKPKPTAKPKKKPKKEKKPNSRSQAAVAPQDSVTGDPATVGKWEMVGESGVTAMHATLASPTKIVIIDRAEENKARFPDKSPAWSVEYDLETNTFRPLKLETNTFCSAGSYLSNGTLVETGGAEAKGGSFKAESGFTSIRHYSPSDTTEGGPEFTEFKQALVKSRWYPSMATLPDGSVFIAGGTTKSLAVAETQFNNPTFEFWPSRGPQVFLPFLNDSLPFNLYPAIHVLPDGNLFMLANTNAAIFDWKEQKIVKTLPQIPGPPRSYPLTATIVMLPLKPENNYAPEILVCGGATTKAKVSTPADDSCGRINLADADPQWEMDKMPFKRVMPDSVILPDGKIMIVNGCQKGTAGFEKGDDPAFTPLVYDPDKPLGERWTQWATTDIARMYHSVALLTPDNRIFVAGSNPHNKPDFEAEPFPTEFRVEMFSPPYLFNAKPNIKPVVSGADTFIQYGQTSNLTLSGASDAADIFASLIHTGFVTHSNHMSQRMVKLVTSTTKQADGTLQLTWTAPPSANHLPPGFYYLHVVTDGTPAKAVQVQIH